MIKKSCSNQFPKLSSINKSYYSVICEAIENSPNKELIVKDIYSYLEQKYARFLYNNWTNSVRHALCLKKYFINIKMLKNKKCGLWRLDPNYKYELETKRRKKIKKNTEEVRNKEEEQTIFQKNIKAFRKKFLEIDEKFINRRDEQYENYFLE